MLGLRVAGKSQLCGFLRELILEHGLCPKQFLHADKMSFLGIPPSSTLVDYSVLTLSILSNCPLEN